MDPVNHLGRSIVLAPGTEPPPPWREAPRRRIDRAVLDDASRLSDLVGVLQRSWLGRIPVVMELGVDPGILREPETTPLEPWRLHRGFSFNRERLHHLIWANSYDYRSGELIWWWGRKAEAIGAVGDDAADIRLPDGRAAWVDGGPRGPVSGGDGQIVHAESVALGRLHVAPSVREAGLVDLAPDQMAAAGHGSGPARIIAPAGSGKTRTLIARIRHLLDDRGVESDLLCALAYNNRAAAEMRERLGHRPGLRVRTIHSLGWEILREAHGELSLIDERDQRRRLEGLVQMPRRANTDVIGPFLEALGEVRIGLRPPEEVEAFRDDVPDLARVYERYRQLLSARGEADFDEQVYGAIEALLRLPELRRRWQSRCRHMVVDEFQDLTPAYLLLIRLLASPEMNVFAVGDDDQVIYGYLGADPGFLIEYDDLFPGAGTHPLEVNYRCPVPVVEAAAALLSYNKRRVDKVIRAGSTNRSEGLEIEQPSGPELALRCAVRVGAWLQETSAAEIAVLSRVNSSLLPVHAAFAEAGIPFRSPLGKEVLERTVLAAALAWIRIGLDLEAIGSSDLMKVIRRPARGLTRLAGQLIGEKRRVSLHDLQRLGERLEGNQRAKWKGFCSDLDTAGGVAAGGDSIVMLDHLINDVGLSKAAAALDSGRRRADRSAQSDDLIALRRAAVLHRDLPSFEAWLRTMLTHHDDDGGVELSTVHRVKGMEWDRVVVFGADRGLFPHDLADDREEERRVFHVAITRGRKEVVVLADGARPSPFVGELSGTAAPRDGERKHRAASGSRDGVAVSIGDRVRIAGGYSGVAEVIEDGGIMVALDSGTSSMLVEWGETVTTAAGTGPLTLSIESGTLDDGLVERLKAWRRQMADDNSVPAYVVMSNKTLLAIAAARPANERQLIMVPGIGPAKLEQYGDDILAICAQE